MDPPSIAVELARTPRASREMPSSILRNSDSSGNFPAAGGSRRHLSVQPRSAKEHVLAKMYADVEKFADITVQIGGDTENSTSEATTFRANRTLLARCSEVLASDLFDQRSGDWERDSVIHLRDCSVAAFEELLRCAHDIEPDVTEDNFLEVFQLARKYEVEELLCAVVDYLLEAAASPAGALRVLEAAQRDNALAGLTLTAPAGADAGSGGEDGSGAISPEQELVQLLHRCLDTVAWHFESLLDSGALVDCSSATVALLTRQEHLCCDEERLWTELLRWSERQELGALRDLAPHIRFNTMSSDFFVDRVVPSGALDSKEVVDLLSARTTGRPARSFPEADIPRESRDLRASCEPSPPTLEDEEGESAGESAGYGIAPSSSRQLPVASSGAATPMSIASAAGPSGYRASQADTLLAAAAAAATRLSEARNASRRRRSRGRAVSGAAAFAAASTGRKSKGSGRQSA
eukprot:TRINITY_DN39920_c0_g1_i1.p1 TRINITY_DN39920_c0_g1~~TRINITY_DN39920_c0_g1_i1.p1  ORF type:complete len:465 (+),score=83.28 TRINITY_DN39920_c0_g1_i1:46-1440(+)